MSGSPAHLLRLPSGSGLEPLLLLSGSTAETLPSARNTQAILANLNFCPTASTAGCAQCLLVPSDQALRSHLHHRPSLGPLLGMPRQTGTKETKGSVHIQPMPTKAYGAHFEPSWAPLGRAGWDEGILLQV